MAHRRVINFHHMSPGRDSSSALKFLLAPSKTGAHRRGRLNIALTAGPAKRRIVVDAGGAQTAVRVGCVPSKALLESSERSEEVRTRLAAHGGRVW